MAEPAERVPRTAPAAGSPPQRIIVTLARRPISWLSGLAALLVGVLLIQSLAAGTLAPVRLSGPRTAPTPTTPARLIARPGEIAPWTIQLFSIAGASANDIWAVGDTEGGGSSTELLLHYDGSSWQRVSSPLAESMSALSVLPTGEAWGVEGHDVLHEQGGIWTVAYEYQPPEVLQVWLGSISMVSSDEGWAAGAEYGSNQSPVLLHFLHGTWTRESLPELGNMSGLYAVSMLSADEGWAVGASYGDGSTGFVLHYANGRWSREGAGFAQARLSSVSAAGPDDAWVVGAGGPTTGIALHCVLGTCAPVGLPTPNILSSVRMLSPTDGWIAGDGAATLRYDGRQWTKEGVTIHGEQLTGIAMTSDREGWAVGSTFNPEQGGSALLRCHNGSWQPYTLHIPDHGT